MIHKMFGRVSANAGMHNKMMRKKRFIAIWGYFATMPYRAGICNPMIFTAQGRAPTGREAGVRASPSPSRIGCRTDVFRRA